MKGDGMGRFRVVNADGTSPIGVGGMEDAVEMKQKWDRDYPEIAPHRIQRVEWVDVPEPEPLPHLPAEVYALVRPDGRMALSRRSDNTGPPISVYRGTVSEWVEVTDA